MGSPLSQLSCTGIGQAGILTPVVRKFKMMFTAGASTGSRRYLDRLSDYIREGAGGWVLRSIVGRLIMYIGKSERPK